MKVLAIICFLPAALPMSATAEDLPSWMIAGELGQIIGSESACGLTYDQAAIKAFVVEKVDPSDMSFTSTLNMLTDAAARAFKDMTPSAKMAHCTAIEQSARHYGFVK